MCARSGEGRADRTATYTAGTRDDDRAVVTLVNIGHRVALSRTSVSPVSPAVDSMTTDIFLCRAS